MPADLRRGEGASPNEARLPRCSLEKVRNHRFPHPRPRRTTVVSRPTKMMSRSRGSPPQLARVVHPHPRRSGCRKQRAAAEAQRARRLKSAVVRVEARVLAHTGIAKPGSVGQPVWPLVGHCLPSHSSSRTQTRDMIVVDRSGMNAAPSGIWQRWPILPGSTTACSSDVAGHRTYHSPAYV